MKIRILAKDPDGIGDSIQRALTESVEQLEGLADNEREALMDARAENIREAVDQFVEDEEYITIEIDTETGTAIVVPC